MAQLLSTAQRRRPMAPLRLLRARRLLRLHRPLLHRPLPPADPSARQALTTALLTPDSALTPEQREWLDVLRR